MQLGLGCLEEIYEIGESPPIGEVPPQMYAQTIRRERFGEPSKAFATEKVAVPEIGPNEVLVHVMAAGINYNNVWAALGVPVDVIGIHARSGDETGFHIGGSDASGIVYAVGDAPRQGWIWRSRLVMAGWTRAVLGSLSWRKRAGGQLQTRSGDQTLLHRPLVADI